MAQQLLAAHVTRGARDGSAGIGAGTTQVDVIEAPETIEICRRIVGVCPVEKCLATDQHRVIEIAAGKMEKLL